MGSRPFLCARPRVPKGDAFGRRCCLSRSCPFIPPGGTFARLEVEETQRKTKTLCTYLPPKFHAPLAMVPSLSNSESSSFRGYEAVIAPIMTASFSSAWALLVISGLLVGCATSSEPVQMSYNASSNATVYETKQMRLEGMRMTEGLERDNRFYVEVSGTCTGQGCAPQIYNLRFIKEGMQEIQIDGRDVQLIVGSETMSWEDPQSREVNRTASIRSGTFVKIELTPEQLTTIGSVRSVRGTMGGTRFSIPYSARSPIRTLVARLDSTASSSASNNSG